MNASGMSLPQRYAAVRDRMAAAAERGGRPGANIVLVAVTKYAAIEQIRELVALGHGDFGENRLPVLQQHIAQVNEYVERIRTVPSASPHGTAERLPKNIRWHMVGHLQRNKVKKTIGLVRLIHSVDSLRLAEELQNAASKREEPVEILIQVNIARESQKSGVAPAAARHLIEQIDGMFPLKVRGLMCMAPLSDNPEDSRPTFEACKEMFDEIEKTGVAGERFNILSMGMSNDFEVAIECGANVVRVGSALFGTPDASSAPNTSNTP